MRAARGERSEPSEPEASRGLPAARRSGKRLEKLYFKKWLEFLLIILVKIVIIKRYGSSKKTYVKIKIESSKNALEKKII